MAAKAIWKGAIAFGRLNVPVELVPTVSDGSVGLRTLHADCGNPVAQRAFCALDERVLEEGETVRAFEVAKGQFVVLDDEDLAAAKVPESRAIELVATIEADDFDPLWARKSYFLAPAADGTIGRTPYLLLRHGLAEADCVAIGRFAAWRAEQLCAICPHGAGSALVLHTLYPAEDRLDADPIEAALAAAEIADEELDLARELAARLRRPLNKVDQTMPGRDRLRAIVETKLAGVPVVLPEPPSSQPLPLPTGDFAGTLRQSLRDLRRRPARKPATVGG